MKASSNEILLYAHRQAILLSAIVSELLNDGKPVDGRIRELESARFIRKWNRQMPGGYSYALLDIAGYNQLHVQANRATQLTPSRLDQRIGLAWFCGMESAKRNVLLSLELKRRFQGSVSSKFRHVITNEFESPAVLR
ncbi:MAG: hypothetical protein AAFX06_26480, partial [Planctomycetota bacterium]